MIIPLLLLATAAAPAELQPPKAFEGLSGCWKAPGNVRGKAVDGYARGEWHLMRNYFMLQLRSVGGKDAYSAAVIYHAAEAPDAIKSYWMDTTGGAYATSGTGRVNAGVVLVDYTYPGSHYLNTLAPSANGWTWTITEALSGKPGRSFAEYHLSRVSCSKLNFVF